MNRRSRVGRTPAPPGRQHATSEKVTDEVTPHDLRHARDRGTTLIEILVATVLLGMVGVAVMTAFSTATRGSALSARVAEEQRALADAHDRVTNLVPYADCGSVDPLSTYAAAVAGAGVEVRSVSYWDGATFDGACRSGALQRIVLGVGERGELEVAKAAPSSYTPASTSTTSTTSTTTTTTTTTTVPEDPYDPPVGSTHGICALVGGPVEVTAIPTAATTLVREHVDPDGESEPAGPLVEPVAVHAALRVDIDEAIDLLDLSPADCTTAALRYETGAAIHTLAMRAEAHCSAEVVDDEETRCVELTVSLSVELPAHSSQTWTAATHPAYLVDADDAVVPGSETTFTVEAAFPPIDPWNPTSPAQGFTLLVEQNATLRLSSSGAVGIGGSLVTQGHRSIVNGGNGAAFHVAPGESERTGLVVGGTLDLRPSAPSTDELRVVRGHAYVGDLIGQTFWHGGTLRLVRPNPGEGNVQPHHRPHVELIESAQSDASIMRSDVFPFDEAFTELRDRSVRLAALDPATCEAVNPVTIQQIHSNPTLLVEQGAVNVLNTTAGALASHGWIQTPQAWNSESPLVINITDSGAVTLPTYQWSQSGDHGALIWNFPNASSVSLGGHNVFGTIFAPAASVTATGSYGNHSGTIVARSFAHPSGQASLTRHRFNLEIACP